MYDYIYYQEHSIVGLGWVLQASVGRLGVLFESGFVRLYRHMQFRFLILMVMLVVALT